MTQSETSLGDFLLDDFLCAKRTNNQLEFCKQGCLHLGCPFILRSSCVKLCQTLYLDFKVLFRIECYYL